MLNILSAFTHLHVITKQKNANRNDMYLSNRQNVNLLVSALFHVVRAVVSVFIRAASVESGYGVKTSCV